MKNPAATATATQLNIDASVPALSPVHSFLNYCARTPGAPALKSSAGRVYTYADMEQHSRTLAVHLKKIGVNPGRVVALYGSKEPAVYIAMLAILRGGYVVLPIDSSLPFNRQLHLAKEARVSCAISCLGSQAQLPSDVPALF